MRLCLVIPKLTLVICKAFDRMCTLLRESWALQK
jgi:hypothetical protein